MILVYCSKCGAKNKDDAKICAKCGESIYPPVGKVIERRAETCFGPRKRREPHVDECFGLPRGGAIVGIVIGLLIILFGVSWILSRYYNISIEIWPIAVIIFGILIIAGVLYGLRRR